MAGDRTEALETGDAQVSGGPRGEKTQYLYNGAEMGYTQVVG